MSERERAPQAKRILDRIESAVTESNKPEPRERGWLQKVFAEAHERVEKWPEWKKEALKRELAAASPASGAPQDKQPDPLIELDKIIERAKSKTPCASHYECLLADLLGYRALIAAKRGAMADPEAAV